MIKQVILPVILKTDRMNELASFHIPKVKEEIDKRRSEFNAVLDEREQTLNDALNDGYVVISTQLVVLDNYDGIHYLLHKREYNVAMTTEQLRHSESGSLPDGADDE